MSMRFLPFRRAFAARPTRSLHTSTVRLAASNHSDTGTNHPNSQRDAQQDREKMDTQPNEYAKSGTDSAGAEQMDAAFDPNSSNDPDEARAEAGKGNEVNPLDASPANPELSSGTSEGGSQEGSLDKKQSEGGGGRAGGGDSTGDKSGGSST